MNGYYFALPRLITQRAVRDESNWLEVTVAGVLMHIVVFCFAFQLLLSGHGHWKQMLMLLPLAVLLWFFWPVLFYFNSICLELLRATGIMRGLSDGRAQSILIGIVVTCFALSLARDGRFFQMIGIGWLILVALNLLAAAVLALKTPNVSAAAE